MYFIPRNNRIYSFLITLPVHVWYLCTLVMLVCCSVGWLILLYLPLERSYLQLRNEYRDLTEQRTSTSQFEQEILHLQHSVDALSATLKTQLFGIPNAKMSFNLLMSRSIDSGLSLLSWITKPQITQNWYSMHPVQFELQGTFEQLLAYLNIFAHESYPLQLQELKIVHKESQLLHIHCLVSVLEVTTNAHAL